MSTSQTLEALMGAPEASVNGQALAARNGQPSTALPIHVRHLVSRLIGTTYDSVGLADGRRLQRDKEGTFFIVDASGNKTDPLTTVGQLQKSLLDGTMDSHAALQQCVSITPLQLQDVISRTPGLNRVPLADGRFAEFVPRIRVGECRLDISPSSNGERS